jgi:hypothetical protein
MNAMTPCPPDSELMRAWEIYQATDDFKNSFAWVTVNQRHLRVGPPLPGSNPVTTQDRDRWAMGSMWAAFMAGFEAAGGRTHF